MRHGEAEPKTASDSERQLTKMGEEQVRRSLAIASEMGALVDVIVTSPILRARETAEIAKEILGMPNVIVNLVLGPDSSSIEVFRELRELNKTGILLVSHQPLVSELISSLLSWHDESFIVRPGTIVKIEVEDLSKDPPFGRLIFFLPPPTG